MRRVVFRHSLAVIVWICTQVHASTTPWSMPQSDDTGMPWKCQPGAFGAKCNRACPRACDGGCTREDGHCLKCQNDSLWGPACEQPCDSNWCAGCEFRTGSCTRCKDGFNVTDTGTCVETMRKIVQPKAKSSLTSSSWQWALVTMAGCVLVLAGVLSPALDQIGQVKTISSAQFGESTVMSTVDSHSDTALERITALDNDSALNAGNFLMVDDRPRSAGKKHITHL